MHTSHFATPNTEITSTGWGVRYFFQHRNATVCTDTLSTPPSQVLSPHQSDNPENIKPFQAPPRQSKPPPSKHRQSVARITPRTFVTESKHPAVPSACLQQRSQAGRGLRRPQGGMAPLTSPRERKKSATSRRPIALSAGRL